MQSPASLRPGPLNLITDVNGVTVGHAHDARARTGVTVLRFNTASIAAADIRGGGPATREVDVLRTENLVGRADALVLSGGSVFGLAAADGAVQALSKENVGLRLSEKTPAIPIAPAASLHDLANDGEKDWPDGPPYRDFGAEAVRTSAENFALGTAGAGYGAMAGRRKGGLGSASIALDGGVMVGALAAVNPAGSVYMPDGKTFYAWPWEVDQEFGGRPPPQERDVSAPFPPHARFGAGARQNTTLAVVATSAKLTGPEAKRVAIMAQDGVARAIRPAHTPFDGDIVFAVATATVEIMDDAPMLRALRVAEIGAASADCLARAIARGVYHAELQERERPVI